MGAIADTVESEDPDVVAKEWMDAHPELFHHGFPLTKIPFTSY